MRRYPYYIVTWREGRLEAPMQFRATPIAKMFESGKIGGTRMFDETFEDELEAVRFARQKEYDRKARDVQVLIVEAPNRHRKPVRDWRARLLH